MQAILTINAGSSSLKCGLYHCQKDQVSALGKFHVSNIYQEARIKFQFTAQKSTEKAVSEQHRKQFSQPHEAALAEIIELIKTQQTDINLIAVGHRVVHGGDKYADAIRIDEQSYQTLQQLIPLAPLHQPFNLQLIEHIRSQYPELQQIACFDTAFHQTVPDLARRYALPKSLYQEGVKRYGFHGLSYQYISQHLLERDSKYAQQRVLIAHLGSGASMCGLYQGQSRATSMGFSALEGLPMSTRCGHVDPGILLYLLTDKGMDAKAIEKLLYKESGLLGVSQLSSDMQVLSESANLDAQIAVDLFVYSAVREIGALAAELQGLDCLVFTAGIGENSPQVREKIIAKLDWLGLKLDSEANDKNAEIISLDDSNVEIMVLPTNEELCIAQSSVNLLFNE